MRQSVFSPKLLIFLLFVFLQAGLASGQTSQSRLMWVSRDGVEQPLAAPPHAYMGPRLSPDGRTIAIGTLEDGLQIWLFDLSRETLSRFTFQGNNSAPTWTPDGKHLAFWSDTDGPVNIFWQRADNSGGLEQLRTSTYLDVPFSFSPDGQLLAFDEVNPTTQGGIWVLRMGDRKAQPFLQTSAVLGGPRFSPDGRWLAYISNESGRDEIYVQPYPGPGGKRQISTEGGTEPVWNPNGRELFYRAGNKMMAVAVTTEPTFSAGKPKMLFEGPYVPTPRSFPDYDVSPDGQRFLMLKPSEQSQALAQINVVQNWFEELKRRVPAETK
jgi:Tol biopolymer transport system component